MTQTSDNDAIRAFLQSLNPSASSKAASPLPLGELYTPPAHVNALDPNRPLVVGNRGVGKSVWSGVLANDESRRSVDGIYPKLGLKSMMVQLGFHESAGKVEGVAPSPNVLASLLKQGISPENIWNAVLLRAVAPIVKARLPDKLDTTITWMVENVEEGEKILRNADQHFISKKIVFMLVFDALDVLGDTWSKIRPLSEGVLRLALSMQGFRAMRAKVFMRTDQIKDKGLFLFPDASKMRAAKVDLNWHATELYGLLFKLIHSNEETKNPFERIVERAIGRNSDASNISDPEKQAPVFTELAGEFMGSDHRRGRTYTWVVDHLADAIGETTPRSFLIALQRAASTKNRPKGTAIDYLGIREGVQAASAVRIDQLHEDYPWIRRVLDDLEGLETPCNPKSFVNRWKERKTMESIPRIAIESKRPGPIELEHAEDAPEDALIKALVTIGVIEERNPERINMPDIFRVAAKIKRRGGVRPPVSGIKHS